MPPAAGSSLELARFRAAFKGRIRFVTIEYPDWRRMIDGGVGFEALVDAAVGSSPRTREASRIPGAHRHACHETTGAKAMARRNRYSGFDVGISFLERHWSLGKAPAPKARHPRLNRS